MRALRSYLVLSKGPQMTCVQDSQLEDSSVNLNPRGPLVSQDDSVSFKICPAPVYLSRLPFFQGLHSFGGKKIA